MTDFANRPEWAKLMTMARHKAGYSQKKVCALLGCTQTQLSDWENGKVRPGDQWAKRLADLYGEMDPDVISGGPAKRVARLTPVEICLGDALERLEVIEKKLGLSPKPSRSRRA